VLLQRVADEPLGPGGGLLASHRELDVVLGECRGPKLKVEDEAGQTQERKGHQPDELPSGGGGVGERKAGHHGRAPSSAARSMLRGTTEINAYVAETVASLAPCSRRI